MSFSESFCITGSLLLLFCYIEMLILHSSSAFFSFVSNEMCPFLNTFLTSWKTYFMIPMRFQIFSVSFPSSFKHSQEISISTCFIFDISNLSFASFWLPYNGDGMQWSNCFLITSLFLAGKYIAEVSIKMEMKSVAFEDGGETNSSLVLIDI